MCMKKTILPPLTLEDVNKIEEFLKNENSEKEDIFFKGVRNGITEYHNKLLKHFEDNPVPSLDNEELKLVDRLLRNNASKSSPFSFSIEAKILSKLKNGVETNNEQPKCSCSTPHYGFKTICLCTDCNGLKDEEYWKELKG